MKFRHPKIVGGLATLVAKSLRLSMSITRIKHEEFDPLTPCIYAFWHGHLLLPIMTVRAMAPHPIAGFISVSKDGEILCELMRRFGYDVARGSTSKKAISGMVQLLKKAREGYSLGLAPDGPRGPAFEVGPGLTFLAAKSGLPVVPVGVHFSRFKQLRSWDRFILPKPFSKAVIYFDQPFYITDINEQQSVLLKEKLIAATETARDWMSDKSLRERDKLVLV